MTPEWDGKSPTLDKYARLPILKFVNSRNSILTLRISLQEQPSIQRIMLSLQ